MEEEAALPYCALGDLLERAVNGALASLPPPQRRELEVLLLLTDRDGPDPGERAVGVATLNLFRQLSRDRPVVVAADDVQWLTAPRLGHSRSRCGGSEPNPSASW